MQAACSDLGIQPQIGISLFFHSYNIIVHFAEVAANKDNSLPSKNLLVLGDRESGKTTLLAKLQGNEDPKKGSGLEFGYIDVRDDDCEEQTNLNHAVLDGDVAHANLLKFALTEENYVDTTVLVCASMATPWSIIDQLNKWIGVLQGYLLLIMKTSVMLFGHYLKNLLSK